MFDYLNKYYEGFYLFRCKGKPTFRRVEEFIASKKQEETIQLEPAGRFARSLRKKELEKTKPLRIRMIRLETPIGDVSVLLTNLLETSEYSSDEIIDLYFKRWEIESYYRDEK